MNRPSPGIGAVILPVVRPTPVELPAPDVGTGAVTSYPLGFVGSQALMSIATRDSEGGHPRQYLALLGTQGEQRIVVEVDGGVAPEMSVATDLMTLDRPTVHRPEPDWPIDWGIWSLVLPLLGLNLIGAFVLWALVRRARRNRRSVQSGLSVA